MGGQAGIVWAAAAGERRLPSGGGGPHGRAPPRGGLCAVHPTWLFRKERGCADAHAPAALDLASSSPNPSPVSPCAPRRPGPRPAAHGGAGRGPGELGHARRPRPARPRGVVRARARGARAARRSVRQDPRLPARVARHARARRPRQTGFLRRALHLAAPPRRPARPPRPRSAGGRGRRRTTSARSPLVRLPPCRRPPR